MTGATLFYGRPKASYTARTLAPIFGVDVSDKRAFDRFKKDLAAHVRRGVLETPTVDGKTAEWTREQIARFMLEIPGVNGARAFEWAATLVTWSPWENAWIPREHLRAMLAAVAERAGATPSFFTQYLEEQAFNPEHPLYDRQSPSKADPDSGSPVRPAGKVQMVPWGDSPEPREGPET